METKANHVLIGAFTLLVLAIAMLFALWLGKATLDREWSRYVVVFNEAVTGLTVGGAVQYNGIQIGEVRELALDPDDPSRVLATVRVSASAPVKTDTVARLAFTGLTGVSVIQLTGGSANAPRLLPGPDGRAPVIIAEASALQKLLSGGEDIAATAGQILVRLNDMLDDRNTDRIANTLANLEATTATLAESRDDIRTLLAEAASAGASLNRTLARADEAFASIDGAVERLDKGTLARLPAAVESLQAALKHIESVASGADALVEETSQSLASFSQQGLAQVGPALDELRRLLRDLRRVTRELEQSPARFIIGSERAPEFEP